MKYEKDDDLNRFQVVMNIHKVKMMRIRVLKCMNRNRVNKGIEFDLMKNIIGLLQVVWIVV